MLHILKIRTIKILALLGLILSSSLSAEANTLNKVSVSSGKDGSQVVKFLFKDAVSAAPIHFTTSNPNRIVLDFADTQNALGRKIEKVQGGAVKGYSVLQAADRTRVVLDMADIATYDVRKEKNQVLVAIRGVAGNTSAPVATPTFASKAATRAYGIHDVNFRRGGSGEGRIEVKLSDPGVGIDVKQKGQTIQVDFLNTSLPASLQRRLDVSEFATPAHLIETAQLDKSTRMVIKPRGLWDYFAYQAGSTFIVEVRSLEGAGAKTEDKPRYSGEKLSLDFQNVEVRAVLKVIADFTGLNIVTSETVGGNLTLRLKDVPWDQALDIIMRTKGLDKRASGNVIWVAPQKELAEKEQEELKAKKEIANLEALVTEPIRLNYLRANEALTIVSGGNLMQQQTSQSVSCDTGAAAIGGQATQGASSMVGAASEKQILSSRGSATFDLKTNTLFVRDVPSKIEEVRALLAQVDVPARQVMIEARLVLAEDNFNRALGARLGFQGKGRIGTTDLGTGGTLNDSANAALNNLPITATPNVNLPVAGGSTIGFTVFHAATSALLSLELSALEADSRGKVISNPRVITTNQRPAVIMQGTQIPYQTSTDTTVTTEFKDASLCLLVDPQILNNDSIIMDLEVREDSQGESTDAGPVINTNRVRTQVRVQDGETVVLGGIFKHVARKDTDKVPLLGDVPVVGNLFKRVDRTDNKSELLVFLTPRILKEGMLNPR